jgi:hypothetical protein
VTKEGTMIYFARKHDCGPNTPTRKRLRGPSGAKDEFLVAATAQNLRKLAKLIPLPTPVFATRGEGLKSVRLDRRRNRYPLSSAEGLLQRNRRKADIATVDVAVGNRPFRQWPSSTLFRF